MAAKRLLYLLILIEILMLTTCMPPSPSAGEMPKESSVEQSWSTAAEGPISVVGDIEVNQQGKVLKINKFT